MKSKTGSVLIVGAGIGGIKAAFDVAEAGYQAYLVDSNPYIGGTLSQLDQQFPTNRCCMCQILPTLARHGTTHYCVRRELYHPNIIFMPSSQVERVKGREGNFTVTLRTEPRWVKEELCINCGACPEVCPVEVRDEYNEGLTVRKAIYARYPIPVPNVYTIDREHCTRCGACVEICPTHAIDLNEETVKRNLEVGAIILASGFEEFDPRLLMQYGHGRYADVLTSIEFERMFSGLGPHSGEILRPSDNQPPRNIAFLQCVGSRDQERNYCSAACCMYALKEAMVTRELHPDMGIDFFFMDARAYGKGYHRFLEKARDEFRVRFTRSRIPVVKENPVTKKLSLTYLDEANQQHTAEYDLVVLSIGQAPPQRHAELGKAVGVELNQWGFCVTDEFSQVKTSKPGVFVCGAFSEPKDIPETITQASAAACEAAIVLNKAGLARVEEKFESKEIKKEKDEPEDWERKVAVFVCQCGGEISRLMDTAEVARYAANLRNVVLSQAIDVLCTSTALDEVKKRLANVQANRVVFAACVPYHYQHLFEEAAGQVGIEPEFVEIVNIREHAAWPHADDKEAATNKAKRLIAMGVEGVRMEDEVLVGESVSVKARALVIGGGAAGMSAALTLAELGIEVDLVEKSERLGGHLHEIYFTPNNRDPQMLLKQLLKKVPKHPRIHTFMETEVVRITGQAGNFRTVLKNGKMDNQVLEHGAVIIATGGVEHIPTEYHYGQNPRILTQREFEEKVISRRIDLASLNSVAMIQCVESREGKRPYCSRICCTQAITHALKIKEANPRAEVVIFNRDIMTYGFREQYYTRAREKGVYFVRYEVDQKPEVTIAGENLRLTAYDQVLQSEIVLEPDLLLLSTGIDAADNRSLSQALELETDKDGFFQEA
ncbi:MAG: FAD-dependent oxidoreductase, partial [candidate division KSB1 bacterium]|nr:FAD-dependent oxidoreductase [candidate division KSB1 bacterium]